MNWESLDTAIRLINQERGNSDPLPKKSLHKLLYRIDVRSSKRDMEITIPYFWYLFGTVSPASPTTIPTTPRNPRLEKSLRPVVSNVLSEYYSHGLEWLTDRMYDDAPHQVQRDFRELDKKVRTLHPEHPDFFEVDPSRESITETVHDVYDSFPDEQFSTHSTPLMKWYNSITRELHSHTPLPDRLMLVNTTFWRIFALELAERHFQGMRLQEIRGHLGIESFEEARNTSYQKLLQIEQEELTEKFSDETLSETTTEQTAADCLASPALHQHDIAHDSIHFEE